MLALFISGATNIRLDDDKPTTATSHIEIFDFSVIEDDLYSGKTIRALRYESSIFLLAAVSFF